MGAKLKVVKMELRKRMHDSIAETGAWVKQMLQGHLNYAVSAITRACGGSATR
jgi:RNA-directed DNA polymerase